MFWDIVIDVVPVIEEPRLYQLVQVSLVLIMYLGNAPNVCDVGEWNLKRKKSGSCCWHENRY